MKFNVMLGTTALLAGTIILTMEASAADWYHEVSGPDVFGHMRGFASVGSTSNNDTLTIQCQGGENLDVAVLEPFGGSQREAHDPVPAKILVKVDNGAVQTLENAEVRPWNDKYIGVVASGRTPDVLAVIHSIGTATRKIEVGLELADKQFSIGFGASGSTAAISALTKACKLDEKVS